MKRIAIALITAAAALAASSARAETRWSIGVNVGGPVYSPAPPAVVYQPAPEVYSPAPVVVQRPPTVVVERPRGYWKEIQVRTWVPERWVTRYNRWGRAERVSEPGYYTYRTDRVWVDGRRDHDRGYGYDHNRYAYDQNRGYGFENGRTSVIR